MLSYPNLLWSDHPKIHIGDRTNGLFPNTVLRRGQQTLKNRIQIHGFKIILSDSNVKSILINIFGGIVRCDRVAQGVIDDLKQININIPIIIRLEGTIGKSASNLLKNAKHDFIVADSLEQAAKLAVKATQVENQ